MKNRNGRTHYEKGHGIYTMEGKNPLKIRLKAKNKCKNKNRNRGGIKVTLADIWPKNTEDTLVD